MVHRAGLLDEQGRQSRLERALIAESMATVAVCVVGLSFIGKLIFQ
jgi:xanthine/uracil/vitamin C permease (AzgA family)